MPNENEPGVSTLRITIPPALRRNLAQISELLGITPDSAENILRSTINGPMSSDYARGIGRSGAAAHPAQVYIDDTSTTIGEHARYVAEPSLYPPITHAVDWSVTPRVSPTFERLATDPYRTLQPGDYTYEITQTNVPVEVPTTSESAPEPAPVGKFSAYEYRQAYPAECSHALYELMSALRDESRVAYKIWDGQTHNLDPNYIGMCPDGSLSFLPKNRYDAYLDAGGSVWESPLRQTGKPARVAKAILKPAALADLSDKDFELFSNMMRARDLTGKVSFRIVEGEDIRHWYNGRRSEKAQGSLSASCMRYDECAPYLELYVANPDRVRMVILTHNQSKKLVGRALLWVTDNLDAPFMDRVYGTEVVQQYFAEYAHKQGWYSREFQSYDRETLLVFDGRKVVRTFTVTLSRFKFPSYPYIDTLKYQRRADGVLVNEDRGYSWCHTGLNGDTGPSWDHYEYSHLRDASDEPGFFEKDWDAMIDREMIDNTNTRRSRRHSPSTEPSWGDA